MHGIVQEKIHDKGHLDLVSGSSNSASLVYTSITRVITWMCHVLMKTTREIIVTSHNFSLCAFSLMTRYQGLSSSPVPTKGTCSVVIHLRSLHIKMVKKTCLVYAYEFYRNFSWKMKEILSPFQCKSLPEFQRFREPIVCKQLQWGWAQAPTPAGRGTSPGMQALTFKQWRQWRAGDWSVLMGNLTWSSDQDTLATGYLAQTSADIQSFSDLR